MALDDNSILLANILVQETRGRYREFMGRSIRGVVHEAVREVLASLRD